MHGLEGGDGLTGTKRRDWWTTLKKFLPPHTTAVFEYRHPFRNQCRISEGKISDAAKVLLGDVQKRLEEAKNKVGGPRWQRMLQDARDRLTHTTESLCNSCRIRSWRYNCQTCMISFLTPLLGAVKLLTLHKALMSAIHDSGCLVARHVSLLVRG